MKISIIVLSIIVIFGAFFTAHIPFDARLAFVSTLFMILFALPSFFVLIKSISWKNGLYAIALLSIFALGIETFAIKTGIPYGNFLYGEKLGAKLFGVTPWTVPFAWVPLVLGTMKIAQDLTKHPIIMILTSTLLLVIADLVLDPGAVKLEFWQFAEGSRYYNVPLSNFIGWIFSGCIGSLLLYFFIKKTHLSRFITISLFLTVLFWTNIALWKELWIPCMIGSIFVFLHSYYLFCKKV